MYGDFINKGEILTRETSFELMRHPTRSIKIQVKEILFPAPINESEKFIARVVLWKDIKECQEYLDPILKIFNVGHMVIGHTPQFFNNFWSTKGIILKFPSSRIQRSSQ